MKNLKRSEKILLSILALAIIFYVYYTFLLSPVMDKVSASHDKIASYNQQLNNIKLKEAQTVKLKADYETYKNDYGKLIMRFPSYEMDPLIGYNLKILADKSKVVIQNQTYSTSNSIESTGSSVAGTSTSGATTGSTANNAEKKAERYTLNFVAVNINISGSYDAIKSFINSLENEERSTIISNVIITKAENLLTASITANFYFISDTQNTEKNSYDFNNKTYGKPELFN